MTALLRFEWRKWISRRETRTVGAFLGLGAIGTGYLLAFLVRMDALSGLVATITRAGPSGFEIAFATLRTMMTLAALFAVLWGSGGITGEVERGTLRVPLLRVPRHLVPGAKALVMLGGLALASLVVLGLSYAVGGQTFGLRGVDAGPITLQSAGALWAAGLSATTLSWFPLASWLSLGVFVSCLARGSQSAITISLILALLFSALTLIPGLGPWLWPDTWWWSFDVATNKAEGLKTLAFGGGVGRHLLVNVGWTTLFLTLGTLRFVKKDLNS